MIVKWMRQLGIPLLLGSLLVGCATIIAVHMIPPSGRRNSVRASGSAAILPVKGGTKANKFAFDPIDQVRIDNETFRSALDMAVRNAGIFESRADSNENAWAIGAEIVSQQALRSGVLAVTGSLVIRYRLVEVSTKREVWHETIITHQTGKGSPAVEGLAGATQRALEGAARDSLHQFIEHLTQFVISMTATKTNISLRLNSSACSSLYEHLTSHGVSTGLPERRVWVVGHLRRQS